MVCVVGALGGAPAQAEWTFAIPEGWTDLSPGKPAPAGVPESVVSLAQGGVYHTYAIDMASGADGFAENLNAIVHERSLVADEANLADYVKGVTALQSERTGGP